MSKDSGKSFWEGFGGTILISIVTTVLTTVVTLFVTKAIHIISPEENRVIISDTLRIVEAGTPQNRDDSLMYNAITELNRTIREIVPKNNNIRIVLPESVNPSSNRFVAEEVTSSVNTIDNSTLITSNQGRVIGGSSSENRVVDKKGFYKKGYSISDGGSFFELKSIPKADDHPLVFEIRLLQPSDFLSHIYLTICATNEKGEIYQYFGQTYDVRDGLNRIQIANNLRKGKNRVEIGVFMKSDEGKDFPTFYRNIFTITK